jgi:V8-like Glu-specific endopeptidase
MQSIRPLFAGRQGGSARRRPPVAVAAAIGLTLALTATACDTGGTSNAKSEPSTSASASQADNGTSRLPGDIADQLKQHGINLDDWKHGGWKNWDKKKWLREAKDFVNPIIAGLWNPARMRKANPPNGGVDNDVSGDQGVTDPTPAPVKAQTGTTPYHASAPYAGKLFFDSPEGSMVCSATVVEDPAHPGKSNLVWTAGHCVHAGKKGGWYRNIAFVPSYNDSGKSLDQLKTATKDEIAPYGVWWGDWAQTSEQWIEQGGPTGGAGAPYDFSVIHVTPEKGGSGKSLQETVGAALPVDFNAPAVHGIKALTAKGYPAAPPYDGQKLFQCADKPGRLSLAASYPTMYRIGCTMTGGSSGGGWVGTDANGKPALFSNTSIGPITNGWLAGPHLGKEAKGVYDEVSKKFANK